MSDENNEEEEVKVDYKLCIIGLLVQLVIAAILIAVVICFAKYILMWVFLIPTLLGFVLHGDKSK